MIEESLKEKILLYQQLQRKATDTPWYAGDLYEGNHGEEYCAIGPYDMSDKIDKHPYEATIAEFWGSEHDCEANTKLVILAVELVPLLIAKIKELETGTATRLAADVDAAIDALMKWRKAGL